MTERYVHKSPNYQKEMVKALEDKLETRQKQGKALFVS
jgi:hypothetical protein